MNALQVSWFGIDFGTTNSAASSLTGSDEQSVSQINFGDDEGRPFPSIVAINKKTGKAITGREARDHRNELSEEYEYFSSIKTIIDEDKVYTIAGIKWTPIDLTAEILKGLKARIRERSNNSEDCKEAVIAVPVGFSSTKRKSLRNAAKKAGITIKQFISEPTAAYFSNHVYLRECRNVAVFDWGGGTLDVAILRVEKGEVHEVATNGMIKAGDDIDRKLAERIHAKICQSKNLSIDFDDIDSVTKDTLLRQCEEAKIAFSDGQDVCNIRLYKSETYGLTMQSITYDYFEKLVDPETEEAIECLEKAVSMAGLNIESLDRILCVGGSSKLRPLRNKFFDRYGEDKLFYPERVMWDIAKGAAIICAEDGAYRLNQDIGLLLDDNTFYPLLRKGQRIPCREATCNFAITNDEKSARFVVTDAAEKSKRSFTQFISVPAQGFMEEQFEVSCFVDPDLLFRMKIRSTLFMKKFLSFWVYDRLKVYYKLSGEDNDGE